MSVLEPSASADLLDLTSEIAAAYVSHNPCSPGDLPKLIGDISAALVALDKTGATSPREEPRPPAVSVGTSIKPEYIVCLEDGRKLRTLKHHLHSQHGLSPEQYRRK